jgi:hypothetical protein
MKRKRQTADNLAVSLFPFLAVLICTMGVLIVMLVMAVKSSHVRAADTRRAEEERIAAHKETILDELDLQQFRIREYEAVRPELQKRLAAQRARRSHLEEVTRRLLDQANELEAEWKQADSETLQTVESQSGDDARIRELESALAERENALKDLRQQIAVRPVLYSIIPTQSTGGTGRRPVYVECRPDGLVLQPSGIKISLDDFTIPVIAGNPLDAALLATREHWLRYDAAGTEGDPYPLLVIRPGGASAYAVARRAMTSWDDEFGYELVESSLEIDWGAEDGELSSILRQVIRDAQTRQRQLVELRQVQWLGQEADGGTRGERGGRGGGAPGGEMESAPGNHPSTVNPGISESMADGGAAAGSPPLAPPSGTTPLPNPFRQADGDFASAGGDFAKSQSSLMQPPQNPGPASSEDGKANHEMSGTGNSPVAVGQSAAAAASLRNTSPLANSRGQDWALPTRTPGATAYRRPIRVDCTERFFVVHNSDPARPPVDIPVSGSIDNSIDALIHQIWNQIDDWGMAEAGGYWKPVLRLSAGRQATFRAAELERKLEGSGIEIERLWR